MDGFMACPALHASQQPVGGSLGAARRPNSIEPGWPVRIAMKLECANQIFFDDALGTQLGQCFQ